MTVKDLISKLDTGGLFINDGDTDYLTYGGMQYRFDPTTQEFEIVTLETPDTMGGDAYAISETRLPLSKIIAPRGHSHGPLNDDIPVMSLDLTEKARYISDFCGAADFDYETDFEQTFVYVVDIMLAWPEYEGPDTTITKELESDVEGYLRTLGITEGLS